MWNRRNLLSLATLALASAAAPSWADASFPNRSITMVVPFPAGGITDAIARMLAQKVGDHLGKPVVVENKPGGGGQIAATYVRQQPADGHTIYVAATEMFAINPTLFRNFSYDPIKDFTPITSLISSPLVLVVGADSAMNNVSELIQQAKTRKNGLSFASQGMGSIGHLLGEIFRGKTGGSFVHVAYKGSAPALQDVMSGQVDFMFDPVISTAPLIAGKKLKPLAIAADQRAAQMPNVPTLQELGISGVNAGVWFGAVAKMGTPDAAVQRLNTALLSAMNDPEVLQRFADQGMQPFPSTPAQFGSFIQSELTRWTPLIKASGASND
jgi:tripartite-type tricarboxylate transporter receptor subunit TctC